MMPGSDDGSRIPPLTIEELLAPEVSWASLVACTESEMEDASALAVRFRPSRVAVRFLRGHRCTTRDALFQEWAAALQFLWYFGWNWDAFDECIADLEWLAADAYLLVVTNILDVLARDVEQRGTFFAVLADAATSWTTPDAGETTIDVDGTRRPRRPPARPFRVIFQSNAAEEPTAAARLHEAGIHPVIRRYR